ncbi:MAG: hypothetical protein Ct9H300mP11_22420 [Chloroflexota bacterium]|nr:MAG: hypothetical protein Ct9H300mP11_22420 [Chloroflexota bacterium]
MELPANDQTRKLQLPGREPMAEIYVLGGGTPTPTANRFGSSHVMKIGDELLMFDCGPASTHKLVKPGYVPDSGR